MPFEILVVDDDALVARTVRRMLPADVTANYTTSKARGIELLRDHEQACGLALIDVRLGKERLAGLDVLDVASGSNATPKAHRPTSSTGRRRRA